MKKLNIKVPPAILANRELSITEKLILALDYSFSLKSGFNILTHIDVAELLQLHKNTVQKSRKRLIEKGYLVKDTEDKRKFVLTDKLKDVEIPLVNGKKDNRTIIILFDIYNHPDLQEGSKLLWGEYNSMSKTEKGYFQKRETTAKRFNVSIDSITNWTKELEQYDFLDEYTVKSGYHTKQKIVRTKDLKKDKEDFEDDF
ncbi:helix-turn-helix domain-containing protein [Chryseobacterium sp. WG23]|uniref:helix-turn-helix domain-containing protein n=1 Tax=Chryseobacterium sp. WG23 TaxID=2926910 RepID=UPI00211EE384|nr:helix-turn-helix domain-containing protein [Chryseobacterium sp. WG23]MCQ9635645.1 helix-turn-helix domain-containing protein [Chryseobacterium sp. WG23]